MLLSWDMRANQRFVGPVQIWFPDNQIQEANSGWLVGWFWMAVLQLEYVLYLGALLPCLF